MHNKFVLEKWVSRPCISINGKNLQNVRAQETLNLTMLSDFFLILKRSFRVMVV